MTKQIFSIKFALWLLLTFVVVSFFCRLGFWQLDRAEEKRVMLAHSKSMKRQKPIVFSADDNASDSGANIQNYQSIQVSGIYDARHILLLDNQFYRHEVGYEVIQPLRLDNNKIIFVSRGWVKAPASRQELPLIHSPQDKITLTGTAYFIPKSLWILGKNTDQPFHSKKWPKRIEKMDIQKIQKKWFKSKIIYPFILRLDAKEPDGFARDWAIVSMPPSRHTGYAIQWFGMAIAVLIIFIVLQARKFKK